MLHQSVIDEYETLRPTHVEINLSALASNFQEIKKIAGSRKVLCVLKANAYGHGLVSIAKKLESLETDYFGVAYVEEGIMLRNAGIISPILVMGGITGDQIPLFLKYQLTITASSVDKLHQINNTAEALNTKAKVHLKIDTGMERIGIHYYSAEALILESLKCQNIEIEGIYSHFANAELEDESYSKTQISRFNEVLKLYPTESDQPPLIHMANSAACLQHSEAKYDMLRVGLLLYGIYPAPHLKKYISLKAVLSWKSHVVFFKVVKPDHPVSYGSNWKSDKLTRVVTIPVGYGDGYFRALSNKAMVVIHGKKYPVVGSICMDQLMVDIGWDEAYNGDPVLLLGSEHGSEISVEDLALWAGTIPYEILTNINTRVPRIYHD